VSSNDAWNEDDIAFNNRLPNVDKPRIEEAVRNMLAAIGEDVTREGLADTPRRIAEMYAEIFQGLAIDPKQELLVGFDEGHQEMVVLRDIPFHSMCEHHLLPFHGVAHIGYIPRGRVVGISKLARVVEILARRPQLQERLTSQIADTILEGLEPAGVAVVIEAEHLCMTMRGIRKPGSKVVTSANRGLFRKKAATRAEFFALIRNKAKE
jgi:GTP cyclohydrolase I